MVCGDRLDNVNKLSTKQFTPRVFSQSVYTVVGEFKTTAAAVGAVLKNNIYKHKTAGRTVAKLWWWRTRKIVYISNSCADATVVSCDFFLFLITIIHFRRVLGRGGSVKYTTAVAFTTKDRRTLRHGRLMQFPIHLYVKLYFRRR